MKTVWVEPVEFVHPVVSAALALPTSIAATQVALAPAHAPGSPITRLSAGSKVDTVGVTVTVSRCPAGTETFVIRSRPCVPLQVVDVVTKSFEYPTSDWLTVKGRVSSGAVSQVSPDSAPEEQLPPPQVCVPEQRLHAPPPAPHAELEVPGMQTSPWQQPLGQVVLLQVATHEVPLHVWLVPQLVHVAPPVPQAALMVPAWQTLPWQQPPGQVVTLQLEVERHCVPLQLWPLPQVMHTPPPVPHALVAVPGWHTFSAQQPVGQVVALQT